MILKPVLGSLPDLGHPLMPSHLWLKNEGGGDIVQEIVKNGDNGGIIIGNQVAWTAGDTGPAIKFPGQDDNWIDCGSSLASKLTLPFTLVSRCKPDSGSSGAMIAISDGAVATDYFELAFDSANGYRCIARNTIFNAAQGGSLNGKFQLIVGVYKTPSLRELWVDGFFVAENTVNVDLSPRHDQTSIGVLFRNSAANSDRFKGDIDFVSVYAEKALTPGEIQSLTANPYQMFDRDPIELWTAATSVGAPVTGLAGIYYRTLLQGVA